MSFLRRARAAVERALPSPRPPRDIKTRLVQGAVVAPHITLATLNRLEPDQFDTQRRPTVLVVDPRSHARPTSEVVDAVQASLERGAAVQRWEPTAGGTPHGQPTWSRIVVSSATTLESVIVPRALDDASRIVVVSSPRSVEGVVRAWMRLAHPSSVMRARLAGNGAEADLALAVPGTYLLSLDHIQPGSIAIANGPLAAELAALAALRILERRQGIESEGPWEDARVQRLTEATIGAGIEPILSLEMVLPDNAPHAWATILARELGV